MENILVRLRRGETIVGDGALGTMLMQRGLKQGEPPELYNLTRSDLLEEIASLYLEAGAEIITTNSFGASPLRLQQFSLDKDVERINRLAVEAVRRVVGNKAYVSASVGPSGRLLKPFGKTEAGEVQSSFQRQIAVLLSSGVDLICIETMTDAAEAVLAIRAARSLDSKIPIMATITFAQNPKGFFTLMGTSIEDTAETLERAGANIIGSNCGNGTEQMVSIAAEFRRYSRLPIAIQSNAGIPIKGETGLIYPETPDFVAAKTVEMLDLGVQVIGGCCGTGPDHIRAIKNVVGARLKSFRTV